MLLTGISFYLFAAVLVGAALLVVAVRNPVHAVLFLILAFFNAAGLFLLLGAEFLAMMLVVVYVGAVAVLFLFVVMMLDVDYTELKAGFLRHMPVAALVGVVLLLELIAAITALPDATQSAPPSPENPQTAVSISNIRAMGLVLYTRYIYYFQACGLILLIAMIGAIVLTLHHKSGVKRQNVAQQVARTRETAIRLVKVKPGEGLKP